MAAQPAQDVAESSTQGEQNVQPNMTKKRRRNVKTGCITCRIRKVKCDEGKLDMYPDTIAEQANEKLQIS